MQKAHGYTLIELVVALAVLALASVLMVEALRLGLHAWDAVSTRLSRADNVALTQQLLRTRLSQLYPYRPESQAGTRLYPLQGQAEEVSFSAPGPHDSAGQMLRYRIFLDHAVGGGALKIAWQADPGPRAVAPPAAEAAQETLLEGVDSAAFEYFARGEHEGGAWMSAWVDKAVPPALVRLRLQFASGTAGDWPALVVRPRIEIPADCEFDPVSRRCR